MIIRLIALVIFAMPLFLGACGGGSSSTAQNSETEGASSDASPVEDTGSETDDSETSDDDSTEGETTETTEEETVATESCIAEEENVNYTDEFCDPDGSNRRTTYIYTREMLDGYSGVTGRLVMTVTGMGGQTESEGQYFIWINGKDGGDTHVISALYHDQPETTRLRHTPWVNSDSRYKEFNSRVVYDYKVDKTYTFVMAWDRTTVTLHVKEGDTTVMSQSLPLSRPFSHVFEVRVGAYAHNVANLGSSFNIKEMRLTFFE
jgi:hypothetical protein